MAKASRRVPRSSLGPTRLTSSDLFVLGAVEVLDELVGSMVRKRSAKMPRDFLDWVADVVTPRLEELALQYLGEQHQPCTPATPHIRSWVINVCQRWLEEKLAGLDPFSGRQSLNTAS
jgi:hypothetical protein